MITIKNKEKCCGCSACMNICPQDCISMQADDEGFLYPKVAVDICIDCRKCEKVCPFYNGGKPSIDSSISVAIQYNDEEKRLLSTAGGAFSLIADYLLDLGAVVYGVGYDESVTVCHKRATCQSEIDGFRGSKYVQSDIDQTYRKIKNDLQSGKMVLFVGTPCQVHGLKNTVGDNELLFTIDLLCLGVSSPALFKKYINYIETKYSMKVTHVEFRNKHFGYATPNVRVCFYNGRYIEQKYDSSVHANLFFKHYYNVRPSCYECVFREFPRESDFTIGDFTEIGKYSKDMDDDKGTTRLWAHTNKGMKLLEQLKSECKSIVIDENVSNIIGGPRKQINRPEHRTEFFRDAEIMQYADFINKWEPKNFRSEFIYAVRPIINRLPFKSFLFKYIRATKRKKYSKRVRELNE